MGTRGVFLCLVVLVSLSLAGCFEKNDFSNQGVCILENTALRAEASKKGQWLSSLALGETVTLMGKADKDPTDPTIEYLKVKLSDGTIGFANTYCIVQGAYVGVIENSAQLYKRPDLLAESSRKLEMMEIVAVEEEKGDWLRITGERRAKSGWILKETIRKDKEDVVTAVLLKKALRGKDKTIKLEEVEKIIATLPYSDNYFAIKTLEKYQTADQVNTEPILEVEPEPSTTTDAPVNQQQ